MTLHQAIVERLQGLCGERKISVNKMAKMCGIKQSTIDNIMKGHSLNPVSYTHLLCLQHLHRKVKSQIPLPNRGEVGKIILVAHTGRDDKYRLGNSL